MLRKIVIINDRVIARGGASGLASKVSVLLASEGHQVVYFSGRKISKQDNVILKRAKVDARSANIDKTISEGGSKLEGLWSKTLGSSLRNWISEFDDKETVYHVHSWSQILSPSVFAILKPVQERVFVTAHDLFLMCPNGAYFDYPREAFCKRKPLGVSCLTTNCDKRNFAHKLWRVARHTALINTRPSGMNLIGIHPRVTEEVAQFGRYGTARTIRNPVTFSTEQRVNAESNKEFLFVGRVVEEKGVRLFLRAAEDAGVATRVMGEGTLENQLKANYSSTIWDGWSSPEEVKERMKKARVVVMPSLYPEPFGLVAVEALTLGIPVLLADTAYIAPEVEALGGGLTVDVKNQEAFSEVLKRLAEDDNLVKSMSSKAQSACKQIANRDEKWVKQHLRAYEEVLKK